MGNFDKKLISVKEQTPQEPHRDMEIYYRLEYVTERSSYQFGTYDVYHYEVIAVVDGVANAFYSCECNQWDDEPEDISNHIHDGLLGLFWDVWNDLDPDFDAFFPASEIPTRYPDAIKYNP